MLYYFEALSKYYTLKACSILVIDELQEALVLLSKLSEQQKISQLEALLGHIFKLSRLPKELSGLEVNQLIDLIVKVNFSCIQNVDEDRVMEEEMAGVAVPERECTEELDTEQDFDDRFFGHLHHHIPAKEESKQEKVTLKAYKYQILVSLVNSELAIDMESALRIAKQMPHDELRECLNVRVKALNKDDDKEEQEKTANELILEVTDGSFFGKDESSHDGFKKGMFKAMGIKH